jgi:molybdenum cofactor biosynthesis enzyme MoaA
MCYFSDNDYRKNNKGKFTQEQSDRIADIMFPYALQVVLGCATEPTLYKDYVSIIKKAKAMGVPHISLTTNAQLISKDKITELIGAGLKEVTVSVHGVSKEMYEKFMPGATHEKLLDFLANLKEEKKRLQSPYPKLRINYTVNPENLDELSRFYAVYGAYEIELLQVRPVMNIGGVYDQLFENQSDIQLYKETITKLKTESAKRSVMLLANVADIQYKTENNNAPIVEAVYRYISPEVVFERDMDWKNEDYFTYCKRVGYDKWLWKNIFKKQVSNEREDSFMNKYSARYEVVS